MTMTLEAYLATDRGWARYEKLVARYLSDQDLAGPEEARNAHRRAESLARSALAEELRVTAAVDNYLARTGL
jgi:hypothetical protein